MENSDTEADSSRDAAATTVRKTTIVVFVATIVSMILLAQASYLWFFAEPVAAADPFIVKCREPIPEFTLALDSHPSEAEVQRLCACVWEKLGTWEKTTARAFAEGREAEVSALYSLAFPSRFGSALKRCGGMDL